MKKKMNVRKYVLIGMMSSLAYVLMMLKFPIPPFPSYLKVDFSDIPALVAALILGPVAGILVELIKNILDYLITGSETGIPVGHFANFIAGISFILPTYFIYNKIKSKKGMAIGLTLSILIMTALLSLFNYFIMLPFYNALMKIPNDTTILRQTIISAIIPFNLLKGIIISIIFTLVFSKMGVWINKQIPSRNV
ncbi:ECF transporter S component [Niallia sp. Sow4_A1]|jgi:riboflavin transporter|uniref:Riboflavin transporter n=1 Tax=Niallia hominis TaxID=3133173 RepID=A0ABV1EWH0_9BACI|nr:MULTISPECIES: ECF transporter S component [Bacillaceae]MCF2647588.1 ECF transporter S component [Niallia circulans]CAI9388017.1 Riboflavin transporter FmnP [Bacillus sp. T2.9-1]